MPPNFSAYLNYRNVTKWIDQLVLPETVVPTMRRAFARLRNGRPRPVLVEVPWDVWDEECPDPTGYVAADHRPVRARPRGRRTRRRGSSSPPSDRSSTPARASTTPRPGPSCARWPSSSVRPSPPASRARAPSPRTIRCRSARAGGRCRGRSTCSWARRTSSSASARASPRPATGSSGRPTKRYIHATVDPADLDQIVPVEVGLVGDAALDPGRAPRGGRRPDPRAAHGARRDRRRADRRASAKEWLADWAAKTDSDEVPMTPYRVMRDLAASVDVARTTITHDAGSPRDQISPFWPATTPLSYIGWGKSTQLGYGLGLAIGREAGPPGPAVHQRHGRRGVRDDRPRLRDRGPRADPDPDRRPQQLLDGDRADRDADLDRALPHRPTSAATTRRSRATSAAGASGSPNRRRSARRSGAPWPRPRPASRHCSSSSPRRRSRSRCPGIRCRDDPAGHPL